MNKEIVLSMDLGGTNLRMAAIERSGKVLCRSLRKTPQTESAREVFHLMVESAEECFEAVKTHGRVLAIAAAVPATVDVERGIILKAPNIPALNNFDICAELKKELDLPCFLENDANAAAIGENWLGASRGFQNSIHVTLGTGVGGGIIIGGKILRGIDGTAGEIGHICVEPFGAPCGCGSHGCVEQYSSATAIVRLRNELNGEFPNSELSNNKLLTALEIYQFAQRGDELALEVFRRQGFYLGIALAGLINVLNPEIIVIGGGAAAGWDSFMPSLVEQLNIRAYRQPAKRAEIVRAQLDDDAGMLGAARLAFENISIAD